MKKILEGKAFHPWYWLDEIDYISKNDQTISTADRASSVEKMKSDRLHRFLPGSCLLVDFEGILPVIILLLGGLNTIYCV